MKRYVFLAALAGLAATLGAAAPAKQPSGKGKFQKYGYTFETKDEVAAFFFEPPLPMNDATVIAAAEHVLETDIKANLNHATHRVAGKAIRFITGSGIYDVAPVKDAGKVVALGVTKK